MQFELTFENIWKLVKYFLLGLAVFLLLRVFWPEPEADWFGQSSPEEPVQSQQDLPEPFEYEEHRITPTAHYRITGIVVGAERYRFDRGAWLMPVDIGLAWGRMSEAPNLNRMRFSQSGRFLFYKADSYPIPRHELETHISNNHCIPSDKETRSQLLSIKHHELVTLEGYLVSVRGDRYEGVSSLSRHDTGYGACEIIWVTRVHRQKP